MSYDSAGNLTTDTYTGAGNRVYDAENRMTQAWGGNNQWQYYTYNADGQRTRRKINAQETWQVYGIEGELVAEYPAHGAASNPLKENGYRNGQLLITATPGGGSNSLSLNGTSNYAEVPNSASLNISGSITLEAWVKRNPSSNYQDIINRESWGQSGTGGGYELSINNVAKARLDLYQTPTTYTTVIGSTTLTTGVWHHIAGVFDQSSSEMRIYVDGVLDGSISSSSAPASGTSNVRLGRNSGSGTYFFNGLIDEVRISNAALYSLNFTPQNNLNASGSTKGLWKFDGQNVSDSSGNGNNGTLVSGGYSIDVPGGGGGSSTQINWLITDQLGTPRMIADLTGSLAGIRRHDYLPFGEELFAGTGGRTTAQGYVGDSVRQKFTQKERDVETNLDYFGARYYASALGRFTGADEIWKDSHVADPQSWNKYAYARNNPLKYIDPNGEAATVTIETDEKNKRGKITVTASIALWTSKRTGLTQNDLQKAAQEYKANIEKSWAGTYEQKGIKFEVSVTVDIQIYNSEQAATDSGAQNVLKVVPELGHSYIRAASLLGGPDRGEIALDAGTRDSEAAHEFTHILGVDDRILGAYVSNTKGARRAMSATAYDYGWAFGGAINDHRDESRQLEMRGVQPANPSGIWARGRERSHTSTRVLGAPYNLGFGYDFWR